MSNGEAGRYTTLRVSCIGDVFISAGPLTSPDYVSVNRGRTILSSPSQRMSRTGTWSKSRTVGIHSARLRIRCMSSVSRQFLWSYWSTYSTLTSLCTDIAVSASSVWLGRPHGPNASWLHTGACFPPVMTIDVLRLQHPIIAIWLILDPRSVTRPKEPVTSLVVKAYPVPHVPATKDQAGGSETVEQVSAGSSLPFEAVHRSIAHTVSAETSSTSPSCPACNHSTLYPYQRIPVDKGT